MDAAHLQWGAAGSGLEDLLRECDRKHGGVYNLEAKGLKRATLYKKRPRVAQLDVPAAATAVGASTVSALWHAIRGAPLRASAGGCAPAAGSWARSLATAVQLPGSSAAAGKEAGVWISLWVLLGAAVLQILSFLLCHWFVSIDALLRYSRARGIAEADTVKVDPEQFNGATAMVPLTKRVLSRGSECALEVSFNFRKLQVVLDAARGCFVALPFLDHQPLRSYLAWPGWAAEEDVAAATAVWGPNEMNLPLPTFVALLQEQMLAPFFVFQMFCVLLWVFDSYWYYSLFTVFMLVSFECTVVFQRLRSLKELRGLRPKTPDVTVYRAGSWVTIPGSSLVPGDLVSVTRPQGQEVVVPADMLLLTGSVIVDEAVLTGESTPQSKLPMDAHAARGATTGAVVVGATTGAVVVGKGKGEGEGEGEPVLHVTRSKERVLFAGTKVLQHDAGGEGSDSPPTPPSSVPPPPDGGCVAVVLRTGFGTSQGRLMRTILYSTDRISANNWETGVFILFLLMFAVAAAGYYISQTWHDPERSKTKILLYVVIIVTSVVPPELPMELTMAVNASLITLLRARVFCTEPFRIPFAGKVDVCCFDKTGTLTSDDMEFKGVVGIDKSGAPHFTDASDPATLPPPAVVALGMCSAIAEIDGRAVGDPLEVAANARLHLRVTQSEVAATEATPGGVAGRFAVIVRHAFNSDLKRMSVVLQCKGAAAMGGGVVEWLGGADGAFVVTKGAPEVVRGLLKEVPVGYDEAHRAWAAQGMRVLALAGRALPGLSSAAAKDAPRADIESRLRFAGFAVFATPLKEGSEPALRHLRDAALQLVMITGDAPLTACHVARQTHIVERQVLILGHKAVSADAGASASDAVPSVTTTSTTTTTAVTNTRTATLTNTTTPSRTSHAPGGPSRPRSTSADSDDSDAARDRALREEPDSRFEYRSPDGRHRLDFTANEAAIRELALDFDLCVTGDALTHVQGRGLLEAVVPRVQVFARVSPDQKELVVNTFKSLNRAVLMCGDGTNDVGALKAAHVGVALLALPVKKKQPEGGKGDSVDGTYNGNRAVRAGAGGDGATSLVNPTATPATPPERVLDPSDPLYRAKMLSDQLTGGRGTQMLQRYIDAGVRVEGNKRVIDMCVAMDKMESEMAGMDAPMVKPGDASMAAPFTARASSVQPCIDILRQGRCTLVTTVQMFKILGQLSLLGAYSYSVQYLQGVKMGDYQATVSGMFSAAMFFLLSQSRPVDALAPQLPQPRVLSPYVFLSLLGQFAVQLSFLMLAYNWALAHQDPSQRQKPDDEFHPNLVNTTCFLVNIIQQVTTFAVNYVGRPFSIDITENGIMMRGMVALGALYFAMVTGMLPWLSDWFQGVPIPGKMQDKLIIGAAVSFTLCLLIERACRSLFPVLTHPVIVERRRQIELEGGAEASAMIADGGESKKTQ